MAPSACGNLWEIIVMLCAIWYHLFNLKKRKKHPCRSNTFKPATLLKVLLLPGYFSSILNCANGT